MDVLRRHHAFRPGRGRCLQLAWARFILPPVNDPSATTTVSSSQDGVTRRGNNSLTEGYWRAIANWVAINSNPCTLAHTHDGRTSWTYTGLPPGTWGHITFDRMDLYYYAMGWDNSNVARFKYYHGDSSWDEERLNESSSHEWAGITSGTVSRQRPFGRHLIRQHGRRGKGNGNRPYGIAHLFVGPPFLDKVVRRDLGKPQWKRRFRWGLRLSRHSGDVH